MRYEFSTKPTETVCDCDPPCGWKHFTHGPHRAYLNGVRVPRRVGWWLWDRHMKQVVREGDAIH